MREHWQQSLNKFDRGAFHFNRELHFNRISTTFAACNLEKLPKSLLIKVHANQSENPSHINGVKATIMKLSGSHTPPLP